MYRGEGTAIGGNRMKPLIGVSCNYDYRDDVGLASHMGAETQDWNFVAADYIRAVEEAGGIPVIIPQLTDPAKAEVILERLDGLLLSGGHDVNPQLYGQQIKNSCGTLMPMRDEQDIALAKAAWKKEIPTLGICRGLQIMAVAFGGTMYQDVKEEADTENHFYLMLPRNYPSHKVSLKEGSRLKEILGEAKVGVNSFHHQAVREIPENAKQTAVSEDGLIEALEFGGKEKFFIGVQWHPEMMYDSAQQKKLFQALVKAAEK